MGRLVGIDYGTKRVGLATTDPDQIVASPLDAVHAADLLDFLKDYAAREPVDAFVVGMPTRFADGPRSISSHVVGLTRTLRRTFPEHRVYTVDESFSSVEAAAAMRAAGLRRKARQNKATVDKVSATIILQRFMAEGGQLQA